MHCYKCGNKIKEDDKFCIKCGQPVVIMEKTVYEARRMVPVTTDKWWQRLLKVVYIFLWLQILWIVPVVWSVNSTSYNYYGGQYYHTDTHDAAFWYSVLAGIIFVVVMRLIKITILYIVLGYKPEWKKQFKKLF